MKEDRAEKIEQVKKVIDNKLEIGYNKEDIIYVVMVEFDLSYKTVERLVDKALEGRLKKSKIKVKWKEVNIYENKKDWTMGIVW